MPRKKSESRKFDVLPDPADFRDRLFQPTLIEVPVRRGVDDPTVPARGFRFWGAPVLNQGSEGACTGFALATVAHYLLRRREVVPDSAQVSPRMFYEMARRYDEWPGEDYSGSSARGAMKGWHKHGVCTEKASPYRANDTGWELTNEIVGEAIRRPLGAYYRVNHKDLVAMHAAIAEVGVLFATAQVHAGWYAAKSSGLIPYRTGSLGGHAFAIVGYDEEGLWLQNSWGTSWADRGIGKLTYDDWLANGMDVWVARLGAPVNLASAHSSSVAMSTAAEKSEAYTFADVRPHIVSVGNDGMLRASGFVGTSEKDVRRLFEENFAETTQAWRRKRLLIYAHGGLVAEKPAIQRVADYRATMLGQEIYPLAFIWKTDFWTTLRNVLVDAMRRRRPEGVIEKAKDFLLDRADDVLEPLVRQLTGKLVWDEIKENGELATRNDKGGGRVVLKHLEPWLSDPDVELHVVAHSAGSIFLAPFLQLLASKGKIKTGPMKGRTGHGAKIASCTLWAPAITTELFQETYLPVINSKQIDTFSLYTLTDDVERDDHCAHVYNKSLLYLVAHALEDVTRIPLVPGRRHGTPILGMDKFVRGDGNRLDPDRDLAKLFASGTPHSHVLAPNGDNKGSLSASRARHHGDFDDDEHTLLGTLARVLGQRRSSAQFQFQRSAEKSQEVRNSLAPDAELDLNRS
jgi:hypothetical protein